jgi:hypothetical protein
MKSLRQLPISAELDAKIGRYCAAGVAAGFVGVVTTADAAPVYINYNNQIIRDTNLGDTSFTLFNFDLNNDGQVDFALGQRISGGTGGVIIVRPTTTPALQVIGISSSSYNYAARLAAGANIGGTTNNFINLSGTGFGARASLVSGNGFPNSQWVAAPGSSSMGFLGIKFQIGGQLVNGFVQLSISDGTGATPRTITLMGAGYETTPGAAITAVAVPEPTTTSLGLLALGALGLVAHRRRTAAKAA